MRLQLFVRALLPLQLQAQSARDSVITVTSSKTARVVPDRVSFYVIVEGTAAAAAALPPVLLWRTVSRILAKQRHRGELLRSLPLLAVFVSAWAAGEVVGSWFGAGDSLRRVR